MASSGYLVEHAETAILFDFGQGTFVETWRYRSPGDVSAVVISHLHADHCVDLIPLRHFVKFDNEGRGPKVYGPTELRNRFDSFQAEGGFLDLLVGGVLEPGTFEVGGLRIEARRVTHIPDSFAFRVAPANSWDGPGLVYSGDCGVPADLVPLIHRGDTLLSEAGWGLTREEPAIHMTAQEAAAAARDGEADRLILTHLHDRFAENDLLEAASDVLAKPVSVAKPGMTTEIG